MPDEASHHVAPYCLPRQRLAAGCLRHARPAGAQQTCRADPGASDERRRCGRARRPVRTCHDPAQGRWQQMAQMKFDRGQYGDAIGHALEALERDPDDKVANSIVAVSGLRLSGKALADLSRQNNLNGSLRSKAQELAKLLRASIGEDVLVPPARRPPAAGKRAASSSVGTPAAKGAAAPGSAADPFSGLK